MIEKCPVCENNLIITKLFCEHCGTTISGQLGSPISPFSMLNKDQLEFVQTFIRCEGKFNRMEEELKLSYPTLKNRFNEVLCTMGFLEDKEQKSIMLSKEDRIEILKQLNQGAITSQEAESLLRGDRHDEEDNPGE